MAVYSVVVPLYNEEAVIEEAYARISKVMASMGQPYEIIFVNDGSRDGTMDKARMLAGNDDKLKVLSFSRNFGHQPAITAGMDHARGRAVVVIDGDMQDPPEVMPELFAKWREGWQVVYGRRSGRKGETLFKKLTARVFYRCLNAVSEIELPLDTGDFRLLDRQVVDAMKALPERNRYVRGLVTWVGFRQTCVEYERKARAAGETKYPLRRMLRLASDGVTAFSQKPLKAGGIIGTLLCVSAAAVALTQLARGLTGRSWSETACWAAAILFAQGLVLLCAGIQNAYLARVYDEAKARPNYIVAEKIGF
ncbi:MAG: glycosyltransferase family 2 protein [Oscillospiraceae bacterium]|nr:glycosyltransferase family 2 protein [Oscillospiraceae bacterium]